MKKAIVSLSTPSYAKAEQRLSESLKGKTDAHVYLYQSESSIGSPSHQENPYAFKIYAIKKAFEAGYTKILWLDSSCYAIKDISPVFDIIESEGYFMEYAGHLAGTWTNDRALDYFGITRDEAMEIPLFSAGFTGLDFTNEIVKEFFKTWEQAMLDGMFRGKWDNKEKTESQDERCFGHRHDLSTASIIAYQLGMPFHSGENLFQYASPSDTPNTDDVVFFLQGI